DGDYYSTSVITDFSIEFLGEHFKDFKNSPFFLYVAYLAPHFPLQAPQEDIDKYRERYLSGWEVLKEERYKRQLEMGFEPGRNSPFEYYVSSPYSWPEEMITDTIPGEIHLSRPWNQLTEKEKYLQATKMAVHAAMVEGIDREVGRLMKYIESIGEDQNTLFLFLSDNGADATVLVRGNGHDSKAPLGSEDSYLCLGPGFSSASNTPFRRHKVWVHEGGISTPLIAYWPQGIRAEGEFRNYMGHVIDILPTFLEIAGVEPLMENNGFSAPDLPGQSLVSIFHEDKADDRELYFSHVGNRALRQGKLKAVYSPYNDGKWQLYDMHTDRTELNDLSSPNPESLRNLSPRWNRFRNQDKLDEMILRWEELDELYLKQGKIGL
ncbi:MAG: sulfatase-like hydrolase/transferase, partial [Bacteroidales bacterium]|nr:sulfatase-like hydrolase/transferase [Bacteroidales bacterium]